MNKSLLIFTTIILLAGCTTLKNWVFVPEVTKISSEAVWQASTLTKPQFEWVERDYKLLRTIHGHNDPVNSVNFANNGFLLASASGKEHRRVFYKVGKIDFDEIFDFEDYSVKLWDTRNGKLLRTFGGHTKKIHSIAFSPDNNTLASCSEDRTVKLWDVQSGELARTLTKNGGYDCSVAFAPKGQILASGDSNVINLWDVRSGELLHTLQGHKDTVTSVVFAPSGNTLASGSSDKTVKLWDIRSGKLLRTIGAHGGEITSVDFAPNGKMLASSSWDGTVKFWDLSSGKLLRMIVAKNGGGIGSVAFTPDSSTLASGHYYHKTVKLWDVQSGKLMHELRGHNSHVSSVAFASDGRVLASGGMDGAINFWRVFSARERDWNKFVAEYNSGNAGLDELAKLAAIYPDLLPKYKELENYDTALSSLRAAVNKNSAINKYLAQRLRRYRENEAVFDQPDQRTRKTLDYAAQYLEEAMWLAYGAPRIEIGDTPKYDSEQKLFHLKLRGQYPQFNEEIAVAMPPNVARALAQNSSEAKVQVSFAVSSASIDLTEVGITFQGKRYKGTPSNNTEYASILPPIIPEVITNTADPQLAQDVDAMPEAATNSRAWLLAVGVEDYKEAPDVPYADNSLELVSRVLAKRFGIPAANRVILQGEEASGTFVSGKIRNTLSRLGPEDTLYFYYSGHGMPGRSGEQLYLAPRDIVVTAFEDDAFAFATLLDKIQQARVGKVLAFLDTCFSGKASPNELISPKISPLMVSAKQQLPDKMTAFYAGTGVQFANAYEDKGHRLFSYFLAQGLVNGLSTVEDLGSYISDNVAEQSRAIGSSHEQIPFVDGRGGKL